MAEIKEPVKEPVAPTEPVKAPDRIDEARALAKTITEQNDRHEKLIERQEKIAADNALGGVTVAGQPIKQETEDEKYNREAKKRWEGTGLDPTPDEPKPK